MTWTKLGDEFGEQCSRLSDAAFRTHVEGLLWCMRRETGGFLSERDVIRCAESEHVEDAVVELLDVDWWTRTAGGYRVIHHMEHQPEVEVIAKRRQRDADRQRRSRRERLGLDPDTGVEQADDMSRRDTARDTARDTEGESRCDSPRDNTRDPGLVGTGQESSSSTSIKIESAGKGGVGGKPSFPEHCAKHALDPTPPSCGHCRRVRIAHDKRQAADRPEQQATTPTRCHKPGHEHAPVNGGVCTACRSEQLEASA